MNILCNALAAGSALFLGFLVIVARRDVNVSANRWLGVFLVIMAILMLEDACSALGIFDNWPHLIGLFSLPAFALAPSFYLSVSRFVAVERRWRRRDWWHFLPVFLFVGLSLPALFWASGDEKKHAFSSAETSIEEKVLLGLMVVQALIYLFFSFFKLRQHRRNLDDLTASPAEYRLDWLRFFLFVVAGLTVVWLVELSGSFGGAAGFGPRLMPFYGAAIYALGFFAMRQKEVFPFSKTEATAVESIFLENEKPAPAVRRSAFSDLKLAELRAELLQKMALEKPHLDPDLNLPALARRLDLSVHETSELINSGFGENFAQFVNRRRVEESKRLLLSENHVHLSMVGIAFAAGFNSKTAFNTAFKKIEGIAPTEFQKRQNRFG